jgi:hypothetical protein
MKSYYKGPAAPVELQSNAPKAGDLPLPSTGFSARLLAAVILGIGVALAIEFKREPSSSLVGLSKRVARFESNRWL